jgi:Putative prokaryotic signal transducing protein
MSVKGWAVIFKGQRFQAEILQAILQADGLRAEVFGDTAYGVGIDLTEARLLVPDDEAETARRIIKEAEEAPAEEESPGDV